MVNQHRTGRGHETVLFDFGTVQITVKDVCSCQVCSQKSKNTQVKD